MTFDMAIIWTIFTLMNERTFDVAIILTAFTLTQKTTFVLAIILTMFVDFVKSLKIDKLVDLWRYTADLRTKD